MFLIEVISLLYWLCWVLEDVARRPPSYFIGRTWHGDHRPTWIIRVQVKMCEARNRYLNTQQYYLSLILSDLQYYLIFNII